MQLAYQPILKLIFVMKSQSKIKFRSNSNKHLDLVNQNQNSLHQPASKQASNESRQHKSFSP